MPDPLETQRQLLLAQITQLGDFRPGSITATRGRCGNPRCHCHRSGDAGHGPNVRLTYKQKGKTRTETFSNLASQRKAEREIAEFRKFQQLSRSLLEISEKICQLRSISEPEPSAQEKNGASDPARSHPRSGPTSEGNHGRAAQGMPVEECRILFLRTAHEHPLIKLGDTLRKEVLDPCEALWVTLGLPVPQNPPAKYTDQQFQAIEVFKDALHRLTREWALQQNLCFDWVLKHASDMVRRWRTFPEAPAFAEWIGYRAPKFILESWFLNESEATYRKRLMADFKHRLDAHVREVTELRRQFLKDRGSQAVHYRWAVERICLGWTWANIAKVNGASVTFQATRKAVIPVLERVGILQTKPNLPKK